MAEKYSNTGKFTVIGHSLGGGLAAYFGGITGCDTITYNAAGVHLFTSWRGGVSHYSDYNHVENVILYGKILNTGSDLLPGIPNSVGERHYPDSVS